MTNNHCLCEYFYCYAVQARKMPNKNNLGFFVLMSDVLSGLSPMIEMEINFYHVFNIFDFLIVSHSGVTLKFTTSGFAPSQNLPLDLPLFMLFVVVSSLVKKKKNDQYDKVRLLDRWTEVGITFKESRNNKFSHEKKHPGFLLPMFRTTGPYSGITIELR